MTTNPHPEAYGVFKPIGCVLAAFPSADDARGAQVALANEGFPEAQITLYTPERMLAQADSDIASAGALASIGQELNLVKSHRELALSGHTFLLVKAPRDEQAQRVAIIAKEFNAARAQSYGRLIIEELIEPGDGSRQVAESPDRGLDAQTISGEEPAAKASS